jgi:hypothetical protein
MKQPALSVIRGQPPPHYRDGCHLLSPSETNDRDPFVKLFLTLFERFNNHLILNRLKAFWGPSLGYWIAASIPYFERLRDFRVNPAVSSFILLPDRAAPLASPGLFLFREGI